MLALKVKDVKNFMNGFLAGSLFDPFLMVEGTVVTSITYNLEGSFNPHFFTQGSENVDIETYEYQPWSDTKSAVYSLIKGTNPPLLMRFMLELKPEKALEMFEKSAPGEDFSYVKALILNIKYENGAITLTSGSSASTFVMSHDADNIWDKNIQKYLAGKGVEFEIMS